MKTYVLYHDQCFDGFGAAWAAWSKLGDEAEYVACAYGKPIPEVEVGSKVYMIDFSLPTVEMLALSERCGEGNLVVLDHHKTAQANLEGLSFAKFDMNKSGAVLSWEHFHPEKLVPLFLLYIQDRDLWLHKLPESKEFSAALQSYPYDFKVWDTLSSSLLIKEGRSTLKYISQLVSMICTKAELKEIDGNKVAMVNATSHWSEVGSYLLQKFPEANYAASYYIEGNQKKWSLRSRENFDVSAIAKLKGGGGHAQASGYVEILS